MKFKELFRIFYAVFVALLLMLLFCVSQRHHEAVAGTIRRAELSAEHPMIVRLALGRSTAISFPVRPEKVVPGNPQAVEINFLGRDLTLRPLGSKAGNLIVYTKTNRYVILLQVVPDTLYDDAVVVNGFSSYSRPIRLTEDSFKVEQIHIKNIENKTETTVSAIMRNSGKVLESDLFPSSLRCKGCVLKRRPDGNQLICQIPITAVECNALGIRVRLERNADGN